jgi:hypothetical protein
VAHVHGFLVFYEEPQLRDRFGASYDDYRGVSAAGFPSSQVLDMTASPGPRAPIAIMLTPSGPARSRAMSFGRTGSRPRPELVDPSGTLTRRCP